MVTTANITDKKMLELLLEPYTFTAKEFTDDYEGIIMWSNELDVWGSGKTKEDAIKDLSAEILGYAEDYCNDLDFWARGNGKKKIPYVLKALILNDIETIGGSIICRHGEI